MTSITINILPFELIGKITLFVNKPKDLLSLFLANKMFRQSISEKELKHKKDSHVYNYTFECLGNPGERVDALFIEPQGIALDGETGNIIVANSGDSTIKIFKPNGELIRIIKSDSDHGLLVMGEEIVQLQNPQGVATTKDGKIIVSDDCLITVFGEGDFMNEAWECDNVGIGVPYSRSITGYPTGVAVNSEGHIIVADQQQSRILVYAISDSEGVYSLLTFGRKGSSNGRFNCLEGLCVDKNDNIIVSDLGNNRVQIFDKTGQFILTFGSKGTGDEQFFSPLGICVDNSPRGEGQIIVCDYENKRLSIWSSKGKFIRHISNLPSKPRWVAISKSGAQVIVSFNDHTIRCISL